MTSEKLYAFLSPTPRIVVECLFHKEIQGYLTMRITVAKHYILGLSDVQAMSSVSLKVMRYVLSLPDNGAKELGVISCSAKTISDEIGISLHSLYNKYWQIQKDLEEYENNQVFQKILYKSGKYTFILGSKAAAVSATNSGPSLRYDSKNIQGLSSMYSLSLYETINKAMLNELAPVIDITMADLPKNQFKSLNIYEFQRTLKRAVDQLNELTDLTIKMEGHPSKGLIRLNCSRKPANNKS